jgi:hypothetical protein
MVTALEKEGDAEAVAVLMALGDERTYLNAAAVEALGGVQFAGVQDYLTAKLSNGDPLIICAAVNSLAKQQGEGAIPAIAKVLKQNRERSDGFQDRVCETCVEALGRTGSAKAIPALEAELRETVGSILDYDYGSKVVAALSAIDDVQARPVLEAYADRLSAQEERASVNPLGRRYMLQKIKEARDCAAALGSQ